MANIQELIKAMVKHQAVRAGLVETGGSYFESATNVRTSIRLSAEQYQDVATSLRITGKPHGATSYLVTTPEGTWHVEAIGDGMSTLLIEHYRVPTDVVVLGDNDPVFDDESAEDLPPLATVYSGAAPVNSPPVTAAPASSPWSDLGTRDSVFPSSGSDMAVKPRPSTATQPAPVAPTVAAAPVATAPAISWRAPASSVVPTVAAAPVAQPAAVPVAAPVAAAPVAQPAAQSATAAPVASSVVASSAATLAPPIASAATQPRLTQPAYQASSSYPSLTLPPPPIPAAYARQTYGGAGTASSQTARFRSLPRLPLHQLTPGGSRRGWTCWAGLGLGAVLALGLGLVLPNDWMLGKMFNLRSPSVIIPALIMGAFWWGLFICIHRWRRQQLLREFTRADVVGQAVIIMRDQGGPTALNAALSADPLPVRASPAMRRMEAVLNQWQITPGMDDADILLSEHAGRDSRELEAAWGLPRILIWALPVLGLIGTVIGISFAVGDFANFLGSEISDINLIKRNLVGVTGGLSFSFLITLLGLASSLLLMLIVSTLQSRERRAVGDVERELVDSFLPALQAVAPVPTEDRNLAAALSQSLAQVQLSLAEQWRSALAVESQQVMAAIAQGMSDLSVQLNSVVEHHAGQICQALERKADDAANSATAHLESNHRAAEAVIQLTQTITDGWKAPIEAATGKMIASLDQSADTLDHQLQDRFEQRADTLGATARAQQDTVEASTRTIEELTLATKSAGELVAALRGSVAALGDGAIPATLQNLGAAMQEFSKSQERTAASMADLLRHTDAILKSHALLMDATQKLDGIGLPAAMHSVREGIQGIAPILASFRQPMVLQFAPAQLSELAPARASADGANHDHHPASSVAQAPSKASGTRGAELA